MSDLKLNQWPFVEANKLLKRFQSFKKDECILQTGMDHLDSPILELSEKF